MPEKILELNQSIFIFVKIQKSLSDRNKVGRNLILDVCVQLLKFLSDILRHEL
jgi:hypothetical protein